MQVVGEDGADLVALVDADGGAGPLAVVAERGQRRHLLVDVLLDLIDGQVEDLDVAVHGRLEGLEQVVEHQLRHLHEGRLHAQLGVAVGGAQDVGQLGEGGVAVDGLEGRREVADVASYDVAGVDVVLRPAGRDGFGRGARGSRRHARGGHRCRGRGGRLGSVRQRRPRPAVRCSRSTARRVTRRRRCRPPPARRRLPRRHAGSRAATARGRGRRGREGRSWVVSFPCRTCYPRAPGPDVTSGPFWAGRRVGSARSCEAD